MVGIARRRANRSSNPSVRIGKARSAGSVPVSDFPFLFSEADLARLWRDQTFPPEALTTTEGERLRVVYRGRCPGGPGPDFRDALIAAPGGMLRGDVELHVRSGDFRRHGHHLDPAYSGVALHVVFEADAPAPTQLVGGGRARVVALGAWVEGRAQEIQRWLERPALWHEPCRSALSRSGAPAVAATLDRLGDMRFGQKTAGFARRLADREPDAVMWEALLSALGYGGAEEPMTSLAQLLPWGRLRADLLPLPPGERARAAQSLLTAAAATVTATGTARAVRPANRPENRCKSAAVLAARFTDRGPAAAFLPLVAAGDSPAMLALLTVPGLIGRPRAVELLANAVLPCLAATGSEAAGRRAEALFARLPLPARYGAVRHLHEAVGGAGWENGKRTSEYGCGRVGLPSLEFHRPDAAAGGSVRINFRRQQGMLYLLQQYCTQGGCGRCPLS
jgi:hypothetical protein